MRSRALLLVAACLGPAVVLGLAGAARAQEVVAEGANPEPAAGPQTSTGVAAMPAEQGAQSATAPASPSDSADESLRVAVVLVGDPNEAARAAAARVEEAVRAHLALPADAALRGSLVGADGEDLIAPVVRDRRALGGTEREDVPLLAQLGDRADVVLLLVVRARAGARELVAFDVRHRAFFEGAIALEDALDPGRVLRFARSRARAASAGEAVTIETTAALEARVAAEGTAESVRTGAARETEHEPEWIELNWPYLVAGALLAGAAAFVIVYTTSDSDPVPMLRFRPGGSP